MRAQNKSDLSVYNSNCGALYMHTSYTSELASRSIVMLVQFIGMRMVTFLKYALLSVAVNRTGEASRNMA